MSNKPTFKDLYDMSDEKLGAILREFLISDLDAVAMGAHSTSRILAVSGGIMLKIKTDDYDGD